MKILSNKNLIVVSILALSLNCSTSSPEVVPEEVIEIKQKKPVIEVQKKDPLHTIEYSYHANSQIEYEASYYNGQLDGTAKHWDENGILLSSVDYVNGKIHGKWIQYYKDGKVLQITEYFHGHKNGLQRRYHQNGIVSSEVEYNMDEQVSEIIRWDSDGRLIY